MTPGTTTYIPGTKRFRRGYLAYAGAGINSRGTQLIMSFQDNLYLGGGSPWEVPFAQVYGYESYQTLGMFCLMFVRALCWRACCVVSTVAMFYSTG